MAKAHRAYARLSLTCLLLGTLLVACLKSDRSTSATPSWFSPTRVSTNIVQVVGSTDTGLPTNLPAVDPSPRATVPLSQTHGVAVVHVEWGSRHGTLIDVSTGAIRDIVVANDQIRHIYSWSLKPCGLVVGLDSDRIVRLDVDGTILETLVELSQVQDHGSTSHFSLSPDTAWFAYIRGSGNVEFDHWDTQTIEVMARSEDALVAHKLAANGGAWEPSWAPSGNILAYSDFDQHGIQQLYISQPSWDSAYHLTDFTDPAIVLRTVRWSPDGTKIAVKTIDLNGGGGGIAIASVAEHDQRWILIADLLEVSDFWWQDSETLLSYATVESEAGPLPGLVWINAETGEVSGILSEDSTPARSIQHPNQMADTRSIGFFSGQYFYVYGVGDNVLEQSFRRFSDTYTWLAIPLGRLPTGKCAS